MFEAFNSNINVNQINYFTTTTIYVNRTIIETVEEIHEKIQYSDKVMKKKILRTRAESISCLMIVIGSNDI